MKTFIPANTDPVPCACRPTRLNWQGCTSRPIVVCTRLCCTIPALALCAAVTSWTDTLPPWLSVMAADSHSNKINLYFINPPRLAMREGVKASTRPGRLRRVKTSRLGSHRTECVMDRIIPYCPLVTMRSNKTDWINSGCSRLNPINELHMAIIQTDHCEIEHDKLDILRLFSISQNLAGSNNGLHNATVLADYCEIYQERLEVFRSFSVSSSP